MVVEMQEEKRSKTIETARLKICILEDMHAHDFLQLIQRNRLHIEAYMPEEILGIKDTEQSKSVIRALFEGWQRRKVFCFGAWDKETGQYVAHVYVQLMNEAASIAEIGYFCDVNHQGCGYVTEAVSAVSKHLLGNEEMHKITLVHDAHNIKSAAVAERCGFIHEGILRQHEISKDGTRPDRWYWGKLRGDCGAKI